MAVHIQLAFLIALGGAGIAVTDGVLDLVEFACTSYLLDPHLNLGSIEQLASAGANFGFNLAV